MSSSYWNSVYSQWSDRARGVNADSFYNKDFVDRMNDARQNLDNLVSEENQANSKVEASKDAYDTFKGQMRHYADVSKEHEDKFGVQTAFDQYEKSKEAVAATQAMINALPSNINANSNVVLTQAQREAAFQNQYKNVYGAKLDTENKQVSEYEKTWETARENATRASVTYMANQQNELQTFNKAWVNAIQNWREAQERVYNARSQYYDIESQYRTWQTQQAALERQRYMAEASNALSAYVATLKNQTNMRIADINAEIDYRKNQKTNDLAGTGVVSNTDGGWYTTYDSRGNVKKGNSLEIQW